MNCSRGSVYWTCLPGIARNARMIGLNICAVIYSLRSWTIRIAQMSEAEQTMVAEVVHNQSGCVDETRLLARYGSIPIGYLQEQTGYRSQGYGRSAPKRVKSLLNLIFYGQCIPTELRDRLIKLLPRPEEDHVAVTAEDALPATVETGRATAVSYRSIDAIWSWRCTRISTRCFD